MLGEQCTLFTTTFLGAVPGRWILCDSLRGCQQAKNTRSEFFPANSCIILFSTCTTPCSPVHLYSLDVLERYALTATSTALQAGWFVNSLR